jgi:hypothetical protein
VYALARVDDRCSRLLSGCHNRSPESDGDTSRSDDAAGTRTIITVPGTVEITVLKSGFAPATAFVQVAAGATQEVVVEIQPPPNVEETVTSWRLHAPTSGSKISQCGSRSWLAKSVEECGCRATSPSLGAASVRIQGMRGRDTRVLSDGLPLFECPVGCPSSLNTGSGRSVDRRCVGCGSLSAPNTSARPLCRESFTRRAKSA